VSISRNHVSRRRRWRRWRRRRRRTSHLDDPLVLIMTPFFIILARLTEPCESFLNHPVHCRFLPAPYFGRKSRLDLTFTEDEMEAVIGVLILVHEFCLHPHVSVPLPNFWSPVVVEQCQQKSLWDFLKVPPLTPDDPLHDHPSLTSVTSRGVGKNLIVVGKKISLFS
jgi:hypothetical protein